MLWWTMYFQFPRGLTTVTLAKGGYQITNFQFPRGLTGPTLQPNFERQQRFQFPRGLTSGLLGVSVRLSASFNSLED